MTEFDRVYRAYFREVELYLRAICRDNHLAEELTEQVFFQALKALPEFRGDCDIRTWLCAMGRNCYWYLNHNDATADTLLWDAGQAKPEEPMYGSWILGWLCIGAAGLSIVFCGLFVLLRKRSWREILGGAAVFFGSWAAASGLVTSFRFMTNFDFLLKLVYILVLTVLMFGTWICVAKLCVIHSRNKI